MRGAEGGRSSGMSDRGDPAMSDGGRDRSDMHGSGSERSEEPMRSSEREGGYGNDSGFSRQDEGMERGMRDDRTDERQRDW
jgi:hypothetical protein